MIQNMMTKKDISNDDNATCKKTNGPTVHFVRMFYKLWACLFQSLGFETVRINLGWWAQWEVRP